MIDLLKEEDIDNILELNNSLDIKTWPKSSFEYDMNNDIATIKVLKINDEVIGYYDIWTMFENVDLAFIAIKKEKQNQGYGTRLMNDIIYNCIKNNVEFINLEVSSLNEKAINLYKKYGFEIVRIRKDYYGKNNDALCMVKGLLGLNEEDFSN